MTQRLYPHLFSAGVFFCLLGLIVHPQASLDASIKGLEIWWTIIFPSLLPFFIVAELLPQSNWMSWIGKLVQPVMKPLFNVSGKGAMVLLLGFTSGFPVGAKLSVKLYNQGALSLSDAQRLVCFTNGASPIFILGAVSAGLLHTPQAGLLLLIAHYAGNIVIGIFAGRMIKEKKNKNDIVLPVIKSAPLSFGTALQNAVATSVQQLMVIGGLIILFSVISTLVLKFNFMVMPEIILKELSLTAGISSDWVNGFLLGILEISNGAATVAEDEKNILISCLAVLAIISFGGFCIHAQIIACIHQSPISYKPFFLARIVHLFISPVIFMLLVIGMNRSAAWLPSFSEKVSTFQRYQASEVLDWFMEFGPVLCIASILVAFFIILSQFYAAHKRI
ncbi:nucleoside recognition domain-containing protein [Jeotgalibacillus proteolyticus]|uniref:nucleoside recognition domain-containing protein n=1 Tax=Jeotgalibacillus proteolyticus TaxID=2082395 RepID=UPI003CF763D8